MVSAAVSVPHLVGGLGRLVPTAVGSDEGPATGANSVSGRAISGSELRALEVPNFKPLYLGNGNRTNMVHFLD